jgi:transposase
MVKIARRVSGGFRSTEGAEAFLAFRSYLSSAAKQGVTRLEALQRVFDKDPWMPATPGAGPWTSSVSGRTAEVLGPKQLPDR